MKHLLLFITPVFLFPLHLNAEVIRIPRDYRTIQAGIDAAQVGDTVLVAAGTYTGTHRIAAFRDSISVCLAMKPGIVVMAEAGPDFTSITNDTAFVIVYIDGVNDTASVIKGFTIQGDAFGIFCTNVAVPIIENNVVQPLTTQEGLGIAVVNGSKPRLRSNVIQGYELGVNIEGASPAFVNNLFERNGSALRIESSFQFDPSSPVVLSNLFRNNKEGFESAAAEAEAFVLQNIFAGNETGAAIDQGKALLTRNIFANNQYGVRALSQVILLNNTMFGDSVGFQAGADSVQIFNTIIWDSHLPIDTAFFSGTLAVNYSDIQGGWQGIGNISQDPLFVHADTLNFHLRENSPCVDAGSDTIRTLQGEALIITDFQGHEPDIGAFESPWTTSVEANDPDVLSHFMLYPNYPNPFNPSTTIRYQISKLSHVVLKIYSLVGQEVRTLINGPEPAGLKSVVWDGRDDKGNKVASGVYLYRLQAGHFIQTKKGVLAK